MRIHNLFSIFTDKLAEQNIDYIITGSVASIIYGEPRLTHDIDIVILLEAEKAGKIADAFESEEFYSPPVEVIKNEILRSARGHFNIIHFETGFKADIYLAGNDDFLHWALNNKQNVEFYGKKISIAPPEYVIIKKLEFYKEGNSQKHLTDIQKMVITSKDKINFETLEKFIESFNLKKEWEKTQQV